MCTCVFVCFARPRVMRVYPLANLTRFLCSCAKEVAVVRLVLVSLPMTVLHLLYLWNDFHVDGEIIVAYTYIPAYRRQHDDFVNHSTVLFIIHIYLFSNYVSLRVTPSSLYHVLMLRFLIFWSRVNNPANIYIVTIILRNYAKRENNFNDVHTYIVEIIELGAVIIPLTWKAIMREIRSYDPFPSYVS